MRTNLTPLEQMSFALGTFGVITYSIHANAGY